MKKPDIPSNEKQRLADLRNLNILDTQAEERFDRLTRLAQHMFDVPIALVCLVDQNRQWFKSKVGIEAKETPRDISFCGHTINSNDPFIITDASQDLRFCDNPLVVGDPNIRFYAGCPLRHRNGTVMGTLCIVDQTPRHLSDADCNSLRDLAELVENELSAVQLATLDELSGLSNKRGFLILAQNALNMCERLRAPVSAVYFDIDDIRKVNEQFGLQEGDRALQFFSELLQYAFRDSDVLGRVGGDEFAVLLTNTPIENTNEILERFKERLVRYSKENELGYSLTFSVGVSWVDSEGEYIIERLLDSAEQIMTKAKQEKKKNRGR